MVTATLQAQHAPPPLPLPISQPPLPTVSHLGPGSIHPDGGFIFVFVCLLIHASSYSGHRRGFRSTTECKSPRRLIHFHLSLVDIQLLSTFPPSLLQSGHLSSFQGRGDQARSDQGSTSSYTCLFFMHVRHDTPPAAHLPPPSSSHSAPLTTFSLPSLTLAPHRGS